MTDFTNFDFISSSFFSLFFGSMQLKQFLRENPHCARVISCGNFNANIIISTYTHEFDIHKIDCTDWSVDRVKHLLFTKGVWDFGSKQKRLFIFENAQHCSSSLQAYMKSDIIKCKKYCLLVFDDTHWTPWSAFCRANVTRTIICQPPTMSEKLSLINVSLTEKQISATSEEKLTIATSMQNYQDLDLYLQDLGTPVFVGHQNQIDRKQELTMFEAINFMQFRARLLDWDQILIFVQEFGYQKVIRILQKNIPTKNLQIRTMLLEGYSLLDSVGVQNGSKMFPAIVCENATKLSKTYSQSKIMLGEHKTQSLSSLIQYVAKLCCARKTKMELLDIFTNCHDPKAILNTLCSYVLDPLVIKELASKLERHFEVFCTPHEALAHKRIKV